MTSRRLKLPLNPFVAAGWQMVFAGVVNSTIAAVAGEWGQVHFTAKSVGR